MSDIKASMSLIEATRAAAAIATSTTAAPAHSSTLASTSSSVAWPALPTVFESSTSLLTKSCWITERIKAKNSPLPNMFKGAKPLLLSPPRYDHKQMLRIQFSKVQFAKTADDAEDSFSPFLKDGAYRFTKPLESRLLYCDQKGACVACKYQTEATAAEVLEDIKTYNADLLSARYYDVPKVVGTIGPVPKGLHDYNISAALAGLHTLQWERNKSRDGSTRGSIAYAIHPSELERLAMLKPFVTPTVNRPAVINISVKARPTKQYCGSCSREGHIAIKCPHPNKDKLCLNCDECHKLTDCKSPLRCKICKSDNHHFKRCDLYRGTPVPLHQFLKDRSKQSRKGSVIPSAATSATQSPSQSRSSRTSSGRTSPDLKEELKLIRNKQAESEITIRELKELVKSLQQQLFQQNPSPPRKKQNRSETSSQPPSTTVTTTTKPPPALSSSRQLFPQDKSKKTSSSSMEISNTYESISNDENHD
jgi:hypothetical protein